MCLTRYQTELAVALHAATNLQRQWRAHVFRSDVKAHGIRHKFVTLQRGVRSKQLVRRVVRMQSFWRGSFQRYNYIILQSEYFMAASMIQRLYVHDALNAVRCHCVCFLASVCRK